MSSLFIPPVVLMLVTMLVWFNMTFRRISATRNLKLDPQKLATPDAVTEAYDERTLAPGNAFRNLFEAPVIFYALIAFIGITNMADQIFLNMAWAYVGLRALQAAVHCTYNRVVHRFYAYLASTIVLWVMVVRFFLFLI